MDWLYLFFGLIAAALFGLAGLLIGEFRGGRHVAGFWLGFLLGPIGILLAGLGDTQCPACRGWTASDATRCPRCHGAVEPIRAAVPASPTADAVAEAMTRAEHLRGPR